MTEKKSSESHEKSFFCCVPFKYKFSKLTRIFFAHSLYIGMLRPKPVPYQRRKKTSSSKAMSNAIAAAQHNLPVGTVLMEHQVAGHTFQEGKDDVGMLKDEHDGSILKPAYKKLCGPREIQFYEQVTGGQVPNAVLLKELVPEYRGTVRMKLGERSIDFIRLADVTHDMTEPCVIDIKIGQRTWDPLASADKIAAEEVSHFEFFIFVFI